MLAKVFGAMLGIVAVVTTLVHSPARPPVGAAKTATTTGEKIANEKNKTVQNAKSKVVFQTSEKKSVKKSLQTTVGAATPAVSVTSSSLLSTLNVQVKTESNLPPPPVDWSTINQKARDAAVNIICTSMRGGSFEPLSGSGIVIDPRGIILTNAHVAQYLLLQDYQGKNFLTCIGRTGSPAVPAYTLKFLYIAPQWIASNYQKIVDERPTGTGENDFALLQIASSTDPELKLPQTFVALSPDGSEEGIKTDDSVLLVGYPAGFLGGIAIQRDLYIVSTIVNIGKLLTFKSNTLDAFSLGGSPVAQHGSSGGAVVSREGKLLGIIVTATDSTETSERDLDAISVSHINRSLNSETYLKLDSLLASDLENFSTQFNARVVPNLKKLLFYQLNSRNQ